MAGALKALDRLIVADVAIIDAAQHGIELVKLPLAYVHITEKGAGKRPQQLGGVCQSVHDRVGVDLEHPGRGPHAQALGQTGQHADEQLHGDPFARKEGAMMLWKGAVAGGAVALTPWTTARMPVGTEIPQPYPAAIVTGGLGAEMPGGIDLTRPPVGRGHRIRSHRWRWGAWEVRPRVHTAHKGACGSGP